VEISFTVPLVPPSVNHYWKHTRSGRHYVTAEGRAYKEAVACCARGQSVRAKRYEIEAVIYLGHGQRGDGDNFWKAIGDGLVEAGVIHSDAAVKRWVLELDRDANDPRTEITVKAMEENK
jgi:crossover junction endodeoxyribonuclease RusA